jgi:Reverse transcriptase (RNA-dependent DNA polymerase)
MKIEFYAIESNGVWEVVLTESMPAARKVVGNIWVLTEKDDGTLRSRAVAQCLSQVPGNDFTNCYASDMTDLAFRLALIVRVFMKLRTGQFDIKTAFLYSDLAEEMYMRIPEGYVGYMVEVAQKSLILSQMYFY